jgi:hypothetical protein
VEEDHVPSGEGLEDQPRERPQVSGIHLDQVPWLADGVVFRLALSVRTGPEPLAGRDATAWQYLVAALPEIPVFCTLRGEAGSMIEPEIPTVI